MATTKKTSAPKKKNAPTAVKKTTRKTKVSSKKTTKRASAATQRVDYYPNRMTLAVSVLAGTLLVLISLIAVLGIQ